LIYPPGGEKEVRSVAAGVGGSTAFFRVCVGEKVRTDPAPAVTDYYGVRATGLA